MRKKIIYSFILLILTILVCSPVCFGAESAKLFRHTAKSWGPTDIDLAANGFRKLGYSVQTDTAYRSSIIDWLHNSTNGYAFYIVTNGATGLFYDSNYSAIYPSDVSGNWHFVYIDSSNSAVNTSFASAFKIYGYSNRAFLGWSNAVSENSSHSFNTHFWDTMGQNNIRQLAINAAAKVPGNGTTPIRFYGDSSWYGYSS